jgi:UDP-3-O-[3-hydroxymyristoyl] N-acetylglucosamine deacetylase/3-hydroxyacyl-[acyl-carrier-protein] dehydratase
MAREGRVVSGKQRTLREPFSVSGVGLHEGREAHVRVLPAEAGTGLVFRRTEVKGSPNIPVDCAHVGQSQRRTMLKQGDAEVHTCEHLVAGLFGCGVDNAVIEIDSAEPPAGDGSAGMYAEAVQKAGLVELEAERRVLKVKEPIAVGEGESSITVLPLKGAFRLEYTLDYGVPELPVNRMAWDYSETGFFTEIAKARTFCLEREVAALRAAGFGKGATTQNTLVVGPNGVLENKLRWADEFTRHKMLDVIGDLALAGCRIEGRVIAVRSGHALNQQLAGLLSQAFDAHRLDGSAKLPGAMDPIEVLRRSPHAYPFLMVDRILEVRDNGTHIIGLKNVTHNEPYFPGHFPNQPVMPGVMQIEAMAQVAGLSIISSPDGQGKVGFLTSIENARFRKAVMPGDRLVLEARILKSRRGLVEAACTASVAGEVASEATLKFMMVPKA